MPTPRNDSYQISSGGTIYAGRGSGVVITLQPQNVTVTEPAAATISYAATGVTSSQMWRKSPGGSFLAVSGATGSSYYIPVTANSGSGAQYYFVLQPGNVQTNTVTLTINAASAAATAIAFVSGPTSGYVGTQYGPFTIIANGPLASAVNVTAAAADGSFTPTPITLPVGSPVAQTFYYTPSSAGAKSITLTNSGGLTSPAPWAFASSAQPAQALGAYRNQTDQLWQVTPRRIVHRTVSSSNPEKDFDYDFDSDNYGKIGPTWDYAVAYHGWKWTNVGGDWIDSTLTKQGASGWGSTATSSPNGTEYSLDFTAAQQYVQTADRWNAVRLNSAGALRDVAAKNSANPPRLVVRYASAPTVDVTLALHSTYNIYTNQTYPETWLSVIQLPLLMEFDKPAEAVASATLYFTVNMHWSGSPTTVVANLVDPPTATVAATGPALVDNYGDFDAGLENDPNVIFVQRYEDSLPPATWLSTDNWDYDDQYMSPEFWGGAVNVNKYPHKSLGKWVNTYIGNLGIHRSTDTSLAFEPIAQGLGAIRATNPASPGVQDGDMTGPYGATGAAARLFLPASDCGTLKHIRIRVYYRFHQPGGYVPLADKKYIYTYAPQDIPRWIDFAGKWGITPSHHTSYGGNSSAGGGAMGWTMRHSFYQCIAGQAGPDDQKFAVGWHLYDTKDNPNGYRYGTQYSPLYERWGQIGGRGSGLELDRWYCVETEMKVNTNNPDGSWSPDGALRTWVDGELVWENGNFVIATLPAYYAPAYGVPPQTGMSSMFGNGGVRDLLLALFHGGQSPDVRGLSVFASGLVVSRGAGGRIGPMRGIGAPAQVQAPLTFTFDDSGPEQISVYAPTTRAVANGTRVEVRYRQSAGQWQQAHPLVPIDPARVSNGAPVAVVNAFAGTIFDLAPGTTYEVELTVNEPGQAPIVLTESKATRALPAASGATTVNATPASNLSSVIAGLSPGAVLELADGTYTLNTTYGTPVAVNGTSSQPITIRGQSRDGVILTDSSGVVLQIQSASHLTIERLTIRGSQTDSGTAADSAGVSFYGPSGVQTNITFRDLKITGVDQGIVASSAIRGCLVYNCEFIGNNTWDKSYIINPASGTFNYSWNDDGIRIPGRGNAAWNNTLTGFGDTCAVMEGVFSAGVHFYRNRIPMTCDDAFEGDYGTRNLSFYDNYIGNSGTFLSLDPLWGGPLYCFRNTSINTIRGPFKFNDQNSGHLVYNNTILRTDGSTVAGWVQAMNGAQENWAYRNNLFVYRGTQNILHLNMPVDRLDFTHNSWYPDRGFQWPASGGGGSTLASARSSLPSRATLMDVLQRHQQDNIVASNPWTETVTLGADHTTQYTALQTLTLAGGSPAKGSGVVIPGITDGYSGAAPDRGAVIAGRVAPLVGIGWTSGAPPTGAPTWKPAPGVAAVISHPYQAHPTTGKKATLAEISPLNMPWYAAAAAQRPHRLWNMDEFGFGGINGYCGIAWDSHSRRILSYGSGHSGPNVTATVACDLADMSWSWLDVPLPTDGLALAAENAGSANFNAAAIANGYTQGEVSTDGWQEWTGSSAAWGALAQPGKIWPTTAHTYSHQVFVPPASLGNANGGMLYLGAGAGRFESTPNKFSHVFDLDTYGWRRTSNKRLSGTYTGSGGSVYYPGLDRVICMSSGGGTNNKGGWVYDVDIYNPITDAWYMTSCGSTPQLVAHNGGLIAHTQTGLLILVTAFNDNGVPDAVGTKFRLFAATAADVVAGAHTWVRLTVPEPATWPLQADGSLEGVSFSSPDAQGRCFATNGKQGANTLWKLTPPAGATTPAAAKAGTWTVDTVTFGGAPIQALDPYGNPLTNASYRGAGMYSIFNRLFFDDLSQCLILVGDGIRDPILAINTQGL